MVRPRGKTSTFTVDQRQRRVFSEGFGRSRRRFPLDEKQARSGLGAYGLHEEYRAEGDAAPFAHPDANVMPVHRVDLELLPECDIVHGHVPFVLNTEYRVVNLTGESTSNRETEQ